MKFPEEKVIKKVKANTREEHNWSSEKYFLSCWENLIRKTKSSARNTQTIAITHSKSISLEELQEKSPSSKHFMNSLVKRKRIWYLDGFKDSRWKEKSTNIWICCSTTSTVLFEAVRKIENSVPRFKSQTLHWIKSNPFTFNYYFGLTLFRPAHI